MRFTIETDRETDGRIIAEVVELPGVLAYGDTEEHAVAAAQALALRVLAERIEQGLLQPSALKRIEFFRRESVAVD